MARAMAKKAMAHNGSTREYTIALEGRNEDRPATRPRGATDAKPGKEDGERRQEYDNTNKERG